MKFKVGDMLTLKAELRGKDDFAKECVISVIGHNKIRHSYQVMYIKYDYAKKYQKEWGEIDHIDKNFVKIGNPNQIWKDLNV